MSSDTATIDVGIKLIYKDFGGVSAYYYGPKAETASSIATSS